MEGKEARLGGPSRSAENSANLRSISQQQAVATWASKSASGRVAMVCQRWDCSFEMPSGNCLTGFVVKPVSRSNSPSRLSARSFNSAAEF